MKLNRQILLIIITLISMISNGIGQDIIPVLEEVSIVEGSSGNVKIRWRHEVPSNVYIFRDSIELNVWVIIDSVKNYSILEYTDNYANANFMNRVYKLRSTKESPDSKKFPTTFLSSTYDSCRAEINLTWSNSIPNFQYQPNVIFLNYEIFLKEGTGNYIKVGSTTEQNYTIPNIKEKTNYTFYIAAIPEHAPTSKSTSNTIDFYSEMAQSPRYINPIIASVNSGIVHLEFEVDTISELTKYKLLRSTSISGPFDTVKSITTPSHRVITNDPTADPSKRVYYYKLLPLNNCDQPIWDSESGIINTIRLTVTNTDNINNLEWNLLKEATNPASNYKIYRSIGNDNPLQIASLINNESSYQDNIEDLIGTNAGSKICYFVIARENTSQEPNNSNTACATIEPKIYIPNAFNPGGKEGRDKFYIKFSFLPEDYKIIIYNRWSNVVFESSDPQKSWDGRSLNGNLVPSGAYIYYIKIVTQSNQTIEKRGNITVIYP
ncbi:MAG: gliding motility-associated C-terminal domain-containing protein [Bacteroidales bacterium]